VNTTQALRALMMSSTLAMVQRRRKRYVRQLSLQNMRAVPVFSTRSCLLSAEKEKEEGCRRSCRSTQRQQQ